MLCAVLGILFLPGCKEAEELTQDVLNEQLKVALRDKEPVSIIRDLIEQGADVNVRYEVSFPSQPGGKSLQFVTPIMFPVTNGKGSDLSIIKELVHNGADAKIIYGDGSTLLHMAVLTDRDGDIIRFLGHLGTPVNVQNEFKQTALFQAVYNENADEIKALIEIGADPYIKDADGNTIFEMIEKYQKKGSLEPLKEALRKRSLKEQGN